MEPAQSEKLMGRILYTNLAGAVLATLLGTANVISM